MQVSRIAERCNNLPDGTRIDGKPWTLVQILGRAVGGRWGQVGPLNLRWLPCVVPSSIAVYAACVCEICTPARLLEAARSLLPCSLRFALHICGIFAQYRGVPCHQTQQTRS